VQPLKVPIQNFNIKLAKRKGGGGGGYHKKGPTHKLFHHYVWKFATALVWNGKHDVLNTNGKQRETRTEKL
jgi:hypothetical protein